MIKALHPILQYSGNFATSVELPHHLHIMQYHFSRDVASLDIN